ncbi:MAG: DUF3726 domain-containing protein [Rhodobacteraceae bacterium]|nr:DUF3726 domain-containing protein [Paracoccaceae bacterium]
MTTIANDPAHPGTAPAGNAKALMLTLPEIQAQAIKAARGAGRSWGMAEEAGYAAVWLAASGIDGAMLLTRHLEATDGVDWAAIAPRATPEGPIRHAAGPAMCPLAAGAYLSDSAGTGAEGREIENLAFPVLILPFLGLLSGATGREQILTWAGGTVAVCAEGPVAPGAARALAAEAGPCTVRVRPGGPSPVAARRATGLAVLHADWLRFDALARRTYVPATATSRADAGAGGSDND